jgi:signal transduction histidine kinase
VASLFYSVEAGVLGPHPGLDGNHGVKIIFIFAVAALAVLIVRKLEKKTREVERLGDLLRERAETAETSLNTFLDTAASGLLVMDENGGVLSANEPLARMLGTGARELYGGTNGGPGFARLRQRLMETLRGGKATESFEFAVSDASPASAKLEIQARVFRLGGRRCVMAVASENGDDGPSAAVESQNGDGRTPAVAPSDDLDASVSVIAHEVKNSMTCVLGLLSLLKDDVGLDARSLELLRRAAGAVEELDSFVSDLLLYSRRTAPRFERADLVSLVDSVAGCLEGKTFRDKSVRLTKQFSVPRLEADVDSRQIQRVMMNLLLNAYQAVRGQGNVWLSVGREDDCAVVEVRDDGCGVPAESMDRLFEPFFTTNASGSGLGLPIARNLVRAHRGTIGVKSGPGAGTSVTVRIPVDRREPGVTPAEASSEVTGGNTPR